MQTNQGKWLHCYSFLLSINTAALFSSHLCTTAPESFNACQQYVQQTCSACKQTDMEEHIYTQYTEAVVIKKKLRYVSAANCFLLFYY